MNRLLRGSFLAAVLIAASCRSLASAEPGGPPVRIDNIYGGFDHQPTESEVLDRERAAGVEIDTIQRERNAAVVDRLYQQLLGQVPVNPSPGQTARVP